MSSFIRGGERSRGMLTVSGADRSHHRASIDQLHTISVKQSYIDVRILEGFVKQGVPSAVFVGSLLDRAVDEALSELGKLAADLRFDIAGQ